MTTIDRLTAELAEAVNDVDGWIEACRAAEDRAESAESQLAALREVLTSVQAMFEHGDKFPQDREPLEPWASNQAALRDAAKAAVAAALSASPQPSAPPCPSCEGLREALPKELRDLSEAYASLPIGQFRQDVLTMMLEWRVVVDLALASSRLPSRQEEGRKHDALTRMDSSPDSIINPPQPRTGDQ
jgi:hypothetical protein